MDSLVTFPDGVKALLAGSSHGFKLGTMETQQGTATYAIEGKAVFVVNASGNTAAFNETQRNQVLGDFGITFRTNLEGADPLEPYQSLSLLEMREEARRKLEQELDGHANATTGLAQAFNAGNTTVTLTFRIPLTHVEYIDESGKLRKGLSPAMMAASEYECRLARDPFKTIAAALTMSSCVITYRPVWRLSPFGRFCPVPMVRRVEATSDTYKSAPGLVLTLEQNGSLATSALERIKATVGPIVVVNEPSTPDEVQAKYEDKPDTEATEILVKGRRTPIYITPDCSLSELPVGAIEAKQVDDIEDWDGYVSLLPILSWQQGRGVVATEAKTLRTGQQLLAVNAAAVEKDVTVADTHLPFCDMVFIPSTRSEFGQYCGLRADNSGSVEVWVPEHRARQAGARIALALQPSEAFPGGNTRAAEMVYREYGREIPCAVTDVDGFESGSYVMEQLRAKLAPYVAAASAQLAGSAR